MKMTSMTRDMLVLAMAWGLAACGGLAAADIGASESSGTGPAGSFEATCTNRGAECDWEITKCKAEPSCARWYACVSSCNANNPQACFEGCKGTTHEPDNAVSIRQCLINGCASGNLEASAGTSGAAGAGYNGGGTGPGPKDVDAAADGVMDATVPSGVASWETCISCLYSGASSTNNGGAVQNCMAQCSHGCEQDFTKCNSACANTDETCLAGCTKAGETCKFGCDTAGTYKHVIGNNVPNEVTGDVPGCLLQTTFEGWEKCMFDSATWVGLETWKAYVSSGLNECVMTQCAGVCIPKDTYQTCSACLESKCTDQAHAYWSSADAQDYGWCMDYCDPLVHDSCDCETLYGEGAETLSQFVMCREQSCFDQCSSQ